MTKRLIFRVGNVILPEGKIIFLFTSKKEFEKYSGKGSLIATEEPDSEGDYNYYSFDNFGGVGIFKSKKKEY